MDIDRNRDFSSGPYRALFEERVQALDRDPHADLPSWVRDDPRGALRGKKFVVCGMRLAAETRYLAQRHEVLAVVDDFAYQKDTPYLGLPVISTDAWIAMARRDPAIVSLMFVPALPGYSHFMRCCAQHQLRWLGPLEYLRIEAGDAANLAGDGQNFVYGLPFFRHALAHGPEFVQAAGLFADDYSRFTYFSLLNYRLTADPSFLARCAVGYNSERIGFNTYNFNRSFVEFTDQEVFVDGGAFSGDSLEQFVRAVRGRFRKAYCFEPSAEQAGKCRDRVRALHAAYVEDIASRVQVVQKGLWSHAARLSFNPSLFAAEESAYLGPRPLSGHIVETGMLSGMYRAEDELAVAQTIETASIDETCEEKVSFIKLEIEGSELEALQGARRSIAASRPKMALSVYHKPEDFLTLTRFVAETGQGYRMSLRQHNPLVPDATVCYCY